VGKIMISENVREEKVNQGSRRRIWTMIEGTRLIKSHILRNQHP